MAICKNIQARVKRSCLRRESAGVLSVAWAMVRLLLWVEHCKSLDLRAGWFPASGGTGFDVEIPT